jgi:hypothetical protein
MVLEANSYVLESLRAYYKGLLDRSDFGVIDLCREEVLSFCSQIDNMIHNAKMEIVRVKTLVQITSSNKALVSFLHVIWICRSFSYTNGTTGSPTYPEPGNRKDGESNYKHASSRGFVSKGSNRNANSYCSHTNLPTSNIRICKSLLSPVNLHITDPLKTLFSTDIVKYQNQGGGGTTDSLGNEYVSFSNLALKRWMQVTLPLTFITLVLGYGAFKLADRKRKRLEIPSEHSIDSKESMV